MARNKMEFDQKNSRKIEQIRFLEASDEQCPCPPASQFKLIVLGISEDISAPRNTFSRLLQRIFHNFHRQQTTFSRMESKENRQTVVNCYFMEH